MSFTEVGPFSVWDREFIRHLLSRLELLQQIGITLKETEMVVVLYR